MQQPYSTLVEQLGLVAPPAPDFIESCQGVLLYLLSSLFPGIIKTSLHAYQFVGTVAFVLVISARWIAALHRKNKNKLQKSRMTSVVYYACSAVSKLLTVLFVAMILVLVPYIAHTNNVNRLQAHDVAINVIRTGVGQGTIILEPAYDLYLPLAIAKAASAAAAASSLQQHQQPDATNTDAINNTARAGLILFPGALLDHRAYGVVAAALAATGVVVVVPNAEPMRLPSRAFGAHAEFVTETVKHVRQTHHVSAMEWAVGGHSLGGHAAAKMMDELMLMRNDDDNDEIAFNKLVLWGLYSLPGLNLHESLAKILLVTATHDGFRFVNEEKESSFLAKLPTRAKSIQDMVQGSYFWYDVQGGNHAGFASYGPQMYYKKDGERTISREEQHRQVVEVVSEFLLGSSTESSSSSYQPSL